MALIIDAQTGTVLDLDECYIVDELTPLEEEVINNGPDSLIAQIARTKGYRLKDAL